jgi:Na+-transporting NADH:ubiquinone oxidoreductase subunit NqrC
MSENTLEQVMDIIKCIPALVTHPELLESFTKDIKQRLADTKKEQRKDETKAKYPKHHVSWKEDELKELLAVKPDIKKNRHKKEIYEKQFGRKYSSILSQVRKLDKEKNDTPDE